MITIYYLFFEIIKIEEKKLKLLNNITYNTHSLNSTILWGISSLCDIAGLWDITILWDIASLWDITIL
jgi:hypothetical protein